MNKLEAIQNHVNSLKIEGFSVKLAVYEDKRRTLERFIFTYNGKLYSRKLDYIEANSFLDGISYSSNINHLSKLSSVDNEYTKIVEAYLHSLYINIGIDVPSNHKDILLYVIEDIRACTSLTHFNNDDVRIAFRRFIEQSVQ